MAQETEEKKDKQPHHRFTLHWGAIMHGIKRLLHHKHEHSHEMHDVARENRATDPLDTVKEPSPVGSALLHRLSSVHEQKETQLRKRYGKPCLLLGKGAYGECWLVKRQTDKKMFAVKEFRKRKHQESEAAYFRRLAGEFCIASVLHHPNVIETLDMIVENSHVYEVMELCEAGNLYDAIALNRMNTVEMDCVFAQLIRGVQYLHSMNVCHRDLKPENCMFDSHNHLKIIDFGSAQVMQLPRDDCAIYQASMSSHLHQPAHLQPQKPLLRICQGRCGSGPYMAPEEFSSEPYDGFKVDIWACAIIYHTMMLHRFPWRNANMEDMHYAKYIRNGRQLQFFTLMPPDQRVVFQGMLYPEPELRWNADQVVESSWFQSIQVCDEQHPLNHHHGDVQSF